MILLKSQKNLLFDAVINENLSPNKFKLKENKKNDITTIEVLNTKYFFKIYGNQIKIKISYSPSIRNFTVTTEILNNTKNLLNIFNDWLKYLSPEISQPDKWKEFFNSKRFIDFDYIEEARTDKFTFDEIKELELSIRQIKDQLSLLSLNQYQTKEIILRLDYLVEKAKLFNKVDWKNILIGTLISIPIQLVLTPQTAQSFFSICKVAFQKVLLLIF